jgi:hypothetical protein
MPSNGRPLEEEEEYNNSVEHSPLPEVYLIFMIF